MTIPAVPAQVRVVTFKINDRDISAREDETILQVARENKIWIPSLCYMEGLSVLGACRLCMVELKGDSRLFAGCSTHVAEGMEVLTDTDRIRRYRRMVVELLFAERNHVCAVCVSNGRCELQNLAQQCGVDHVRVPYRTAVYHVDASHDWFRVDHNRCVLCTALRAGLRRDRRGPHLGHDGTRHQLPGDHRPEQTLGRKPFVHRLWQVRAGLSDRGAGQARHVGWRDGKRSRLPPLPVANEAFRMTRTENKRITVATAWLDGCSGCHMSFLDIDDRLFALAKKVDIIYSPLVDAKHLPETVDVGILEGSVSTDEDLKKAQEFRRHCKYLISLGDCAVCGNVPGMRNFFPLQDVLNRAYIENVQKNPQIPTEGVPALLDTVQPVHGVVDVDLFVQGCPPPADVIWHVLSELIEGRMPEPMKLTRFGK